jgi:YVTN family beta-propeller protein
VLQEIVVGGGPSAVSILGNSALVLNLDTDTVSIINMTTKAVTATVAVGRSPRGLSSDTVGGQLRAYVTNQNDGSISVIDVAAGTALTPLQLGVDVRPQSILVLPGSGMAIVTEPTGAKNGKVLLVNLTTGAIVTELSVNPDQSGGSSDIALFGSTVYFNNQSGGSVTAAKFVLAPAPLLTPQTIKVGIGARALAIDTLDNWLVVTNQGSGEVVLIDLTTNQIVGRINGVQSEGEDDKGKHDDHDDRDKASNMPSVTSISPNHAKAGTSFLLTIIGKNLTGATGVAFVNPEDMPGNGHGNGNSGNQSHGPFAKVDPAFTVTNVQVNAAGTQVTATVAIAANASKSDRSVRVLTPNGESTFLLNSANSFKVE